jgi:hypothetical protein
MPIPEYSIHYVFERSPSGQVRNAGTVDILAAPFKFIKLLPLFIRYFFRLPGSAVSLAHSP